MSQTHRIAYLDISPRQTGKTERLIQHAKTHLEAGQRVCFVTLTGLVEDTRRRLPGAAILKDGEELPTDENPDDAVWFYDEFDWLDSIEIRPGAYYATTPKRLREAGLPVENDMLLRLIAAHGGHYRRYTWPFDMSHILKEARSSYSREDFRLLYLGEFLK
ncbi:hypothetical protein ATI02_5464 [Pseudomonas baetica]|uniref:Uncharacterized protein n=1 Tax=Pseudomonas baetica TaxID=674054 RepID=A0ABX4Q6H9_9PSED|nr:hypothetical protein [Pseudomonas baetica]PKA72410.1 hypothetical protein ATI02_5464 [Pseudomonas baetica]PTC17137.1 hypothetical protein C0J26_24765 [Pseudomonas baetica]